jgi:hypothetical protein
VNQAFGAPIRDLDLNVLVNADPPHLVGFTGFTPLATQTLGAVATMLEHGVPIVFAYISDAHDDHVNNVAFGPGQLGYVQQLKAYDKAFGQFFGRRRMESIRAIHYSCLFPTRVIISPVDLLRLRAATV